MLKNQPILAIDTATGPASVAIYKDDAVAIYLENHTQATQSARLLPMIEQALSLSGLSYADLATIACTTGPGSFTGIRVGLAAAQGIAFAARIGSVGFTTLEVLSFAAKSYPSPVPQVLAALRAGKGQCYYQAFSLLPFWQPLYDARVGTLEEAVASVAPGALMAGNLSDIPAGLTVTPVTCPRADALAQLTAAFGGGAEHILKPFYIRPPDAVLPLKKI